MSALLIMLSISLVDQYKIIVDHVDLIEINHYYDQRGKLVLDQIIFWDWRPDCQYHVVDWRLLKSANQLPDRNPDQPDQFICVWRDGEVIRQVTAAFVRETWTLYDPEVADRKFVPKNRRRKLTRGAKHMREKIAVIIKSLPSPAGW